MEGSNENKSKEAPDRITLTYDPDIIIAEGTGMKCERWTNASMKLSEFYERLRIHRRTTEKQADFLSWKHSGDKALETKAKQIKDRAGGFLGGAVDKTRRRRIENVDSRYLLTYDIDSGVPFFDFGSGISCARYTTHSHTPEHPRFRIVAPLSRPVSAEEYERLSRLYAWEVADSLGMAPEEIFTDDSTFSPEHFQYWPSAPMDAEVHSDYQDGRPLDVDRILDTDREPFKVPSRRRETGDRARVQRPEGEKVQVGERYPYLMSILGDLCRKLAGLASADSIITMLWDHAHEHCEGIIDGGDKEAFSALYKPAAEKFLENSLQDNYDWTAAVRTYFEQHPGEAELPQIGGRPDWTKIRKEAEKAGVICEKKAAAEPGAPEASDAEGQEIQGGPETYEPSDYTDVGQSRMLFKAFGQHIRFNAATSWLVWTGKHWEESQEKARRIVHRLTDLQLKEARRRLKEARAKQDAAIEAGDVDAQKDAQKEVNAATAYRAHVLSYRKTGRIDATLKELAPLVWVDVKDLDADGYLLNTPAGTYDLRTGVIKDHDPRDLITKITKASPSGVGAEEWKKFLEQVTSGDKDLEHYLHLAFGMGIIGRITEEKLMIPWGSGGNGKSTITNAVYRALGDYSGSLTAEALVIQRNGPKYELAELRGKRYVLAGELQEGQRLNTSMVKRLCSTDMVAAEKKFKDPFFFEPSHHVFLFTNHLPRLGANDQGTLDRLAVLPFKGRFRNTQNEVKNYGQVLADRCGGAILDWIIWGAQEFIADGCRLPTCGAVDEATAAYKESADWLGPFVDEMCSRNVVYSVPSGELYSAYRKWCEDNGEPYVRSSGDFKAEMEKANFIWRRTKTGGVFYGLDLGSRVQDRERQEQLGGVPKWAG